MNYQALRWLIDNLVQSYKCPECWNWVVEANIDIIWAAWNTINVDVECSKCQKHSMIKSEVLSINLWEFKQAKDTLLKLKNNLENIKSNLDLSKNVSYKKPLDLKMIKDEEIVDLNSKLKTKDFKVEDLFWES